MNISTTLFFMEEIMLTLSRKVGERILIGEGIAITIVKIGGNKVRIGIDAPRDLKILREEVSQKPLLKCPGA